MTDVFSLPFVNEFSRPSVSNHIVNRSFVGDQNVSIRTFVNDTAKGTYTDIFKKKLKLLIILLARKTAGLISFTRRSSGSGLICVLLCFLIDQHSRPIETIMSQQLWISKMHKRTIHML